MSKLFDNCSENIIYNISLYLKPDKRFKFLNNYYSKQLDETDDEEYVYKLECLYEWWEQEKYLCNIDLENVYNNDYYDRNENSV